MKAIDRIRARLAKEGLSGRVPELEEELEALGDRMINDAFLTKKRDNITYNQHDAYGWGLFFNGSLIKKNFITPQKRAQIPRDTDYWGRDNVSYDIDHFVPSDPKGYVLLVLNSVYYSIQQEDRGQEVLSQEIFQMDELQQKYNGHIELVNMTRRR